jgi:hypothetical protein
MKLLKIILIILLVSSPALLFAQDSPGELLDCLPDEVGLFKAGKVVLTDKNIRRKYRFKDSQINVELYDMAASIKDGYSSKKIQEIKKLHLKSARDTTIKVGYEGGKVMKLAGGGRVKYLFSRFLTTDYKRILLDLYLTGIKGYVCKIWVTREGVISFRKEKRIQDAVRVIFSRLSKPHSKGGACP